MISRANGPNVGKPVGRAKGPWEAPRPSAHLEQGRRRGTTTRREEMKMAKRRGNGDGSIVKHGHRWVASDTVESTGGRQARRKRTAWTGPTRKARTKLWELQEELRAGIDPGH